MANDKQTAIGSHNIQVDGNNNIIVDSLIVSGQRPLTHSLIYDLLGIVYLNSKSTNYSLQDPVPMKDKLRFNNAMKYIHIIYNHSDDYAQVDFVMKDYPDSENIIKHLRDMFLDVAEFDKDGSPCVSNGDKQLDSIKKNLKETIAFDSHFDKEKYTDEQIEQFCIALIACGISKCKILEKPA